VVGTGGVEDSPDLLGLSIGPLLVHGTTELDESTPDAEQAESDDGLLVDDIVLVAESVDGETGGRGKNGGLGDDAATGQRVNDGLGLGLGVLDGQVRGVADGSQRRGDALGNNGGPEAGGPCVKLGLAAIESRSPVNCRSQTHREHFSPSGTPLCNERRYRGVDSRQLLDVDGQLRGGGLHEVLTLARLSSHVIPWSHLCLTSLPSLFDQTSIR
jgi:hypothetical protein